jgi:hypothetical protein
MTIPAIAPPLIPLEDVLEEAELEEEGVGDGVDSEGFCSPGLSCNVALAAKAACSSKV